MELNTLQPEVSLILDVTEQQRLSKLTRICFAGIRSSVKCLVRESWLQGLKAYACVYFVSFSYIVTSHC